MKILHFVGLCSFVGGKWDNELVVSNVEEIEAEALNIPLPRPVEEMGEVTIGKIPRFPEEGMNTIEGWVLCEDIEEGKVVVEKFSKKFGEIHNKEEEDPFLGFLKGMLDTLKGLRDELQAEEAEHKEIPEELYKQSEG